MPLTGLHVIYGGSFNPPHFGHLTGAIWMKRALKAQCVDVIPTHTHPYKPHLTDFKHRYNMCIKTFHNGVKGIGVSRLEEYLPHPNIMINTIKKYAGSNIVLAIGSDLVDTVHKWDNWEEIQSRVKIIVIGRQNMEKTIPFEAFHYSISISAVSSTQIRENIKQGKDITGMVVWQVQKYIKEHKLYMGD